MRAARARFRRRARGPPDLLLRRGSKMRTLARFGCAAVFGFALGTTCTLGQVGIDFNGSPSESISLQAGDSVVFHVIGSAGAPFAALISPETRFEVTAYGLLL